METEPGLRKVKWKP